MDVIDRLVARLSTQPLWTNGMSPTLDLPVTASANDLVGRVFERISFDRGTITQYTIERTRRASIGRDPGEYTAAVVETNLGRKIVLLRREGGHWWSRVYDDEP